MEAQTTRKHNTAKQQHQKMPITHNYEHTKTRTNNSQTKVNKNTNKTDNTTWKHTRQENTTQPNNNNH